MNLGVSMQHDLAAEAAASLFFRLCFRRKSTPAQMHLALVTLAGACAGVRLMHAMRQQKLAQAFFAFKRNFPALSIMP
jgi:hypothetical protein